MLLQLAIDCFTEQEAAQIARETLGLVDILEAGTPLILKEGVGVIRSLRREFPDQVILADMKIIDGAAYETRLALDAGANVVTVLAAADDLTIRTVADTAAEYDAEVMVDLIGIEDLQNRAREIDDLGVDYLCVHRATDLLTSDSTPPRELGAVKGVVKHAMIAVAGGVNARTIGPIMREGPDIVIVGSAITASGDAREAARELRALMSR
jgi:3-hexulose-6-phosphate synthase